MEIRSASFRGETETVGRRENGRKAKKAKKERERESRRWCREEESVTKGVVRGPGLEVVVIARYYGLEKHIASLETMERNKGKGKSKCM